MTTKVTLPEPAKAAELLSDIIGKQVHVESGSPMAASAAKVTAIYTDEGKTPLGACVCELGLAASLGAALVRMPRAAAHDAIAGGTLPENLLENFSEVLNIATQLFRPKGARDRVILGDISLSEQALAPDLAKAVQQPAAQLHLRVSIPGYDEGQMSLATLHLGES